MHSPLRILLVVDHPPFAESIQRALGHGVCVSRVARTVEETVATLAAWPPHLAIVDVDMGEGRTLDDLDYTASTADHLPLIALTRRGSLQTKLATFERGVDDVLTVPFAGEELRARVLALARRVYRNAATIAPTLRIGELEIDFFHRRVLVCGEQLHLTSLELELLYLLAANAGQVLTRNEILDHIWGIDYVAESNVVDRHIYNLRAKLRHIWRHSRAIATIPGRGYSFVPTT